MQEAEQSTSSKAKVLCSESGGLCWLHHVWVTGWGVQSEGSTSQIPSFGMFISFVPCSVRAHVLRFSHIFTHLHMYCSTQVGVLSWNVGGISDHRKDQGAGLEEATMVFSPTHSVCFR